ncbi:hypothetical protein L228DRAFT_269843 [Xylona heveae TC161]|uniref:HSF-type DNA-binding domain-containing protein n=1 Tax=Xylona heveae (strain CBS 132557 / TC161) TaxID=1328760 RepID=A0A165AII2_XYLHT|nr:hypothetical protein L228DRAFT_269843 [Xylona heveae TC161]KZF20538.1 hypothetical protein L228DRAFT_269843 [Xylona heveae TC161]
MPPFAGSRKRPAPGTSPAAQPPSQQESALSFPIATNSPRMTNEQFLGWNQNAMDGTNFAFPDPSAPYGSSTFNSVGGGLNQSNVVAATPSNQLTRRPTTQHLVSRPRPFHDAHNDPWADFGEETVPQQNNTWSNGNEDITQLEQRALVAKRDAQAKRKQIPPFVQKLSSFLDESKNTDLIRWSDNGDSFIVLDEDEFAKTLIPELFKHNNYASFVRQLNMYGFHKRVGLSDNSMRASEKKHKSPSEYWNPYFKRGHPELLWLIQKPKNPAPAGAPKGGKAGARGGKSESVDDGNVREESYEHDGAGGALKGENEALIEQGGASGRGLIALPRNELANVREELETIQNQQKQIAGAIQRLRQQNQQLYEQAAAFQTMHDRHENSINAILTFLATFYNRSLDGQGGQNLASMFAGAMPHDAKGQRNVVDLSDFQPQTMDAAASPMQRPPRKAPLLLKAPPAEGQDTYHGKVTSVSPGATSQHSDIPRQYPYNVHNRASSRSGTVEEVVDAPQSGSPPVKPDHDLPRRTGHTPEEDIMSLINNANASNEDMQGPGFDFPAALNHFENADGNTPLTNKQRTDMLNLMANNANATKNDNNNALVSPAPPPMPGLDQLQRNREELDMLSRLQAEQDSKVQHLTSMLQPLSPTGSIPGLADGQYYSGQAGDTIPPPLDIDQIFNSGDYFANHGNGDIGFNNDNTLGSGINFDFDDSNATHNAYQENTDRPDRVVETTSNNSAAASPANPVVEDVTNEITPRKRRRNDS